jgi:hypothetical protein
MAATMAQAMDPVGWGERWTQDVRTHTAQVEGFTLRFTYDMEGDPASASVRYDATGADTWRGIIRRGTEEGASLPSEDIQARMWALEAAFRAALLAQAGRGKAEGSASPFSLGVDEEAGQRAPSPLHGRRLWDVGGRSVSLEDR